MQRGDSPSFSTGSFWLNKRHQSTPRSWIDHSNAAINSLFQKLLKVQEPDQILGDKLELTVQGRVGGLGIDDRWAHVDDQVVSGLQVDLIEPPLRQLESASRMSDRFESAYIVAGTHPVVSRLGLLDEQALQLLAETVFFRKISGHLLGFLVFRVVEKGLDRV